MVDRVLHILFFSLLGLSATVWAQGQVRLSSSVEPLSGTTSDRYVFSVVVEGLSNAKAPLLSGGDDFDLEYTDTSASTVIRNGEVSQQVEFHYELSPKKAGRILTPSVELEVSGQRFSAAPIPVSVSQAPEQEADPVSGTSLKQSISEETLYVGQQTIVTLSLLSDQQLVDASFSDLRYDGVWKEDLGKERSFRRMIDRREFIVHQLRHALFPLRPGEVTIPRRVMTVTQLEPTGRPMGRFGLDLFDPNFFGFNRKRSVKLQSKPVTLQVKKLPPVPANLSNLSSQHVLVGDTSLSLGYNSEPLKVGDSVTVTYELKTEGNANPLEELPIHFPKTVKVYPETPQLEKKVVGNRLEFHKQFRYSIVPLNGGDIEIPEVQLLYFVPEIGEYRTANARPVKLSVVGLPSDTVVGASTVISAPQIQPTEPSYAPYEELTFAQRMNRQLSLPLAVVVSAMLALLAVLSFLAYEVFRRRSLGFANLREVDNASTLGDLKGVFLRQLSKRLSASANLKTRQELQFALEKNQVEPGLSHQIVTLFDDFEFSQYGKEDTLFHEVRERTKALLSKFR